ncbi:MAG: hypothetical protein ACW99G_18185, partial [Candidatus Thorarchaeota archaeon]
MSSFKGRVEEKVEITMTATKRKHLTFKTISSFMENLLYICDDVEVIINVDDVGESGPRETTLKIIELFVPVKVSRFSETPNFSTAFAFCWQQVEADWVVHLEDDWELLQKVDVREMMAILKEEEDLALLRLPQFRSG